MALDDDIRILSAVGLFEDLSADQLRLMAFGAETMRFAAGRELYREGDAADCAYVIANGSVALTRASEAGSVTLARFGAGAILGEMALIAATSRLTSAVAETELTAIRLNRTLFRRILEEYPDVAVRLHARISADLQALIGKIEKLAPRFAG